MADEAKHAADVALDRVALDKVLQLGGPELLGRLIDMFLENAPERLARAQQGHAAGDMDAVERATHSLKSTAGNLGARGLQNLSQRIEELAAGNDAAAIALLLPDLERSYAQTRDALAAERRRLVP